MLRRYRTYTSTTLEPGSKSYPHTRDRSCSRLRTCPGLRRNASASANSRAERSTSRSDVRARRVRRSRLSAPCVSTVTSPAGSLRSRSRMRASSSSKRNGLAM
ncbi:Uncharacterised protein [Mycobacteroides abscessus]|nr:Uncharacterised protein [Mycobacteroides abscessus]